MDYCGFVKEMQVRGISFTGRISEITFATSISCLAKERCIPSIAHFEINTRQQGFERKIIYIYIF